MKNRDPFFDNAKLFAMFLVILGHFQLLPTCLNIPEVVREWLFAVHMPVFVMISGYLSHCDSPGKMIKNSITRILIPYVIFQTIWLIYGVLPLGDGLLTPQWTLWYLLSLFWWRVGTALFIKLKPCVPKVIRHPLVIVLVSFLPLSVMELLNTKDLAIKDTFLFLPFFVIGYVCIADFLKLKKLWKFSLVLCALVLTVSGVYNDHSISPQTFGPNNYWPSWQGYCISIIFSFAFLSLIPKFRIKFVTSMGTRTLYAYLLHSLVIIYCSFALIAFVTRSMYVIDYTRCITNPYLVGLLPRIGIPFLLSTILLLILTSPLVYIFQPLIEPLRFFRRFRR